jgi:hypothetical protein
VVAAVAEIQAKGEPARTAVAGVGEVETTEAGVLLFMGRESNLSFGDGPLPSQLILLAQQRFYFGVAGASLREALERQPKPYDLAIGLGRSDQKVDFCLIDSRSGARVFRIRV